MNKVLLAVSVEDVQLLERLLTYEINCKTETDALPYLPLYAAVKAALQGVQVQGGEAGTEYFRPDGQPVTITVPEP